MLLDKLTSFLDKHFVPIAMKIGENKYLQSIRDGVLMTMPFIMLGSIFLITSDLPVKGYPEFMAGIFGPGWKEALKYPIRVTFDMMAIFATVGIAYKLGERNKTDPLLTGMTALSAFVLSAPLQIVSGTTVIDKAYSFNYSSSKGLFVAIIIAILVAEVFNFATKRNLLIKMPESVPPSVSRSFSAIIPGGIAILLIWAVKLTLLKTGFGNIHNFITTIVGTPVKLLSGSLIGLLIGLVFQQLLWAVGLHGSSILMTVMRPPFIQLLDENRMALEAGHQLPNVINLSFYELWVQVGGSGTTLGLAFALLFFVKSKQLKQLGKIAIVPSLFNINEPLSFGIPIIMNPLLLIPWIIVPLITTPIVYFAMASGLVAKATGVLLPWTTPSIISGFLATSHISGALMQLVVIVLSGMIYYPFIMLYDKKKCEEEAGVVEE